MSVMAFNPAVAIYDASILYPFHLRNIVVQAAVDGLVDARWTDAIHDEWMRNLLANTADLPAERLAATKQLMNVALPEATVGGYEKHIQTIKLPKAVSVICKREFQRTYAGVRVAGMRCPPIGGGHL